MLMALTQLVQGLIGAKGYAQTQIIDYGETFAPVVKMLIVHVPVIATIKGSHLHQLDIKNVFL